MMIAPLVVAALVLVMAQPAGALPGVDEQALIPCEEEPGVNDQCPAWVAEVRGDPWVCLGFGASCPNPDARAEIAPTGDDVVSPDGSMYFTAVTTKINKTKLPACDYQFCIREVPGVVAFDSSDGSVVWSMDYEGTESQPQGGFTGLTISPDGTTIYLVGYTKAPQGAPSHGMVIAVDAATGETLWVRNPVVPEQGALSGLTLTRDGTLVATGFIYPSVDDGTWYRMLTVALDPSDGTTQWRDTIDGPAGGVTGYAVAAAPTPQSPDTSVDDGATVYVHGAAVRINGSRHDLLTVAYRSTGDRVWSHRDDRQSPPVDFAVTPDGTTLVSISNDGTDALVVAYATQDGRETWRTTIPGSSGTSLVPRRLVIDPDSTRAYFIADRETPDGQRFLDTVALRMDNGTQLWRTTLADYDPAVYASPDIAVNPKKKQIHVVARDGFAAVTLTYNSNDGSLLEQNRDRVVIVGVQYSPFTRSLVVALDGDHVFVAMLMWENTGLTLYEQFTRIISYKTPT